MTQQTTLKTERLFWDLAAQLMREHADVTEGTIMNGRCVRVGKQFLALVVRISWRLAFELDHLRAARASRLRLSAVPA